MALAKTSAVLDGMATSLTYLENASVMTRMYLFLLSEVASGPKRSACKWWLMLAGCGKGVSCFGGWLHVTVCRQQSQPLVRSENRSTFHIQVQLSYLSCSQKDGSLRPVLDYRALDEKTRIDKSSSPEALW